MEKLKRLWGKSTSDRREVEAQLQKVYLELLAASIESKDKLDVLALYTDAVRLDPMAVRLCLIEYFRLLLQP